MPSIPAMARSLGLLIAGLPVFALSLIVLTVIIFAPEERLQAAQGKAIDDQWWGIPFAWNTHSVSLQWAPPAPGEIVTVTRDHCIMHLGQTTSELVLYDVTAQNILRVPRSQVVILIPRSQASC